MKLNQILTEAIVDQEWRFSEGHDGPEYTLMVKYTKSKDFEYAATFVRGREDHFEFFKQGTLYHGDHIEFGSERTAPRKSFYRADELNAFLKQNKLPELSEAELNKLHPDDVIMIGLDEGLHHFFRISLATLKELKGASDSFPDFKKLILTAIKKVIRKNNWFMQGDKLRAKSEDALEEFYKTGKRPKPTI